MIHSLMLTCRVRNVELYVHPLHLFTELPQVTQFSIGATPLRFQGGRTLATNTRSMRACQLNTMLSQT